MVLERRKKSLPGRESFNCSFKKEVGAAKAQNKSSVIGVSPNTQPQERLSKPPATGTGHGAVASLGLAQLWDLAGCGGMLGSPVLREGRLWGQPGGPGVPAVSPGQQRGIGEFQTFSKSHFLPNKFESYSVKPSSVKFIGTVLSNYGLNEVVYERNSIS